MGAAVADAVEEFDGHNRLISVDHVPLETSLDLFIKRSFAEEILEMARVGDAINQAGIFTVEQFFQSENIKWTELFAAERVDLFFIGSSTWRNRVFGDIQQFFGRRGTRMRVFLPDPANPAITGELAARMNYTVDDVAKMIRDAYSFFQTLAAEKSATDRLTLTYVDRAPFLLPSGSTRRRCCLYTPIVRA